MSNDGSDHWMLSESREGNGLPVMVIRRWDWFGRASKRARLRYGITELMAICGASAIPVAAGISLHPAVLSGLAASVIVATGVRTTFGFHENWITFSRTRYDIERECALYLVGAAPYGRDDAMQVLVSRVEDLSTTVGTQWAERRGRLSNHQPPGPLDVHVSR